MPRLLSGLTMSIRKCRIEVATEYTIYINNLVCLYTCLEAGADGCVPLDAEIIIIKTIAQRLALRLGSTLARRLRNAPCRA